MKHEFYLTTEKPFILKSALNENDFRNLFNNLSLLNKEIYSVLLNGEKMKEKDSLLKEFSAQLHFPDYFGENWDAFDECINDLSWINAKAYVIGILKGEYVLSLADKKEKQTFIEIINETCEAWAKSDNTDNGMVHVRRPLHIIIQYENANKISESDFLSEINE